MRKKLVMFEGLDCCGKDTQIELFTQYLNERGKRHVVIRNPIDKNYKGCVETLLGNKIDGESFEVYQLMTSAIRSTFLLDKITSILPGGRIAGLLDQSDDTEYIIMNRFYSSLIYNFGKISAMGNVNMFRNYLKEHFNVDLIVIELKISPYISKKRLETRDGEVPDRFENLTTQFTVDDGYEMLAKSHPNYIDNLINKFDFNDIWIRINGDDTKDEIAARIRAYFDILITKENDEEEDKESMKHIIQVIKILPEGEEPTSPCTYLDVKDPGFVDIESYLNRSDKHMLHESDISSIGDKFMFDRYILFMPDSSDVEPIVFVTHRIIPGNCWNIFHIITEYSALSLLRCEFIFGENDDKCLKLTNSIAKGFGDKMINDLKLLLSDVHAIPYIGVTKSEVSNIDYFYKVKGLFHDNIDAEKKSLVAVKFRVKEVVNAQIK